MTGTDFDRIVKNRANQRVKKKLDTFRNTIANAFKNLTGSGYVSREATSTDGVTNWSIFSGMAAKGGLAELKEWPHYLWDVEEGAVRSELLSIMDEMQKALLAPEHNATENDDRPAPGPEV